MIDCRRRQDEEFYCTIKLATSGLKQTPTLHHTLFVIIEGKKSALLESDILEITARYIRDIFHDIVVMHSPVHIVKVVWQNQNSHTRKIDMIGSERRINIANH